MIKRSTTSPSITPTPVISPTKAQAPTATPIPPTSTPIPSVMPVDFTGASEDEPGEDVPDYINIKFKLQQEMPIETDSYIFDYDYAAGNFIVTIKEQKDTNRTLFDNWLAENGYNVIPPEEIVYQ